MHSNSLPPCPASSHTHTQRLITTHTNTSYILTVAVQLTNYILFYCIMVYCSLNIILSNYTNSCFKLILFWVNFSLSVITAQLLVHQSFHKSILTFFSKALNWHKKNLVAWTNPPNILIDPNYRRKTGLCIKL